MFSFYGFYQLFFRRFHDFLELLFDEFFRQIEKVWHFCFHQFLWQFDLTRKIQLFGNSGNSTKFSWKRFRYLKEIKTDIAIWRKISTFGNSTISPEIALVIKIITNLSIWREKFQPFQHSIFRKSRENARVQNKLCDLTMNFVIWRIFCFFYRWASRAPCRGPPAGALPPAATVPAPPSQRPKMSTTSSWSWSATRGWANPAYWRNF